jgi:hypothetical protein
MCTWLWKIFDVVLERLGKLNAFVCYGSVDLHKRVIRKR